MSSGMRIWGPTGALELDETSFTVRVILSALVTRPALAEYLDVSVPGADPATCNAVVIPIGSYTDPNNNSQDAYRRQFEPQVLNNLVRVWFRNRALSSADVPAIALGTQRLLVMRYR